MPEQTEHLGKRNTDDHSFESGRDSEARKFYQSYAWRRFRKRIMIKRRAEDEQRIHDLYKDMPMATFSAYAGWLSGDKPLCVDCIDAGHIRPGAVADHITRIRAGGEPFKPENIQFLCSHHHNVKSGKESSK